ncbi:hypothetical protein [Xanthomonas cannabis]|uniref:hypothetical protein n=1 Tax=Xanthomonas cannabis TaxID=1885674 RepID=UPI0033AAC425
MNIAFLFNSDHPTLGGYYGGPVMDSVLSANILQGESRSMRVSVGDILTFSAVSQSEDRTYAALETLCRAVYVPVSFDRLKKPQLEDTYNNATVYCWLFQNMTQTAAEQLHLKLRSADFYLGCMDVDFSNSLHLQFFRDSLIEKYRLTGKRCAVFYEMGQNEDPDISIKELFEREDFEVEYEDQGARRTIFDNYDSLAHFKRVESFKAFFSTLPNLCDDDASALTHSLEELHPKLFDAFAAAARALERAETEEDYAQAALSGRRLLERTADALFPASELDWNGRKVGSAQYKNRLWAHIDKAISSTNASPSRISTLGKEADRLIDLFNSGLHAHPTREKVELAFRDLVIWLSAVIDISPSMARGPYKPYEDEMDSFFGSVFTRSEGGI